MSYSYNCIKISKKYMGIIFLYAFKVKILTKLVLYIYYILYYDYITIVYNTQCYASKICRLILRY